MKILFAATPAASHLNPILTIARMFVDRGDEVLVATGTHLRAAVEKVGARFLPLVPGADLDFRRMEQIYPERAALTPGPEQFRFDFERVFLDTMPPQAETLRAAIVQERPDIVVTDAGFLGRAALFIDPDRPAVPLAALGFTVMSLDRADRAPFGIGLPPARDEATRARYEAIAAEVDAAFTLPIRAHADAKLAEMGLPAMPCSVPAAWVLMADAYMHPTVPAFEYDFDPLPAHVRFVGTLPPPPPHTGPVPDWWGELDSGKLLVLVTQGTLTTADFGQLAEPTLEALADRDDLLVLVTTGGRAVDDVQGPIPRNARLAEFLDYAALLPRLSALVTNGGYGTVSLALRAGVPIVAAGRTEDKAEIGARVAWSGTGIEIPKQRPVAEELRDAVGRVLSDPSYRERAQAIAADMAATDTRAEILGALDGLVSRWREGARAPVPR